MLKKFKIYYTLKGNGFDGRDIETAYIEAETESEAKYKLIKDNKNNAYIDVLHVERS